MIPAVLIFFVILFAHKIAALYTDYLWYDAYGQTETFWTLFLARFSVHAAFSAIFFVAAVVLTFFLHGRMKNDSDAILFRTLHIKNTNLAYYLLTLAAILFLSYLAGGSAGINWKSILLFFTSKSAGSLPQDPIFGLDSAFYFFTLPFLSFLRGWLFFALFLFVVYSAAYAFLFRHLGTQRGLFFISEKGRGVAILYCLIFLLLHATGFYLGRYQLLFQHGKSFYGAGYTAVHAGLFTLWAAIVITAAGILVTIFFALQKRHRASFIAIALTFAGSIVLNITLPSLQQRFIVEPNELALELPFIEENIRSTRMAYGLGELQVSEFAADAAIDASELVQHSDIIDNIRLWDWRPLLQTYRQIQELKPYYRFSDIDIDRYDVNGSPRAFNVSARELDTNELSQDAHTWMNRHLVYTHGYGVVMSRVDRITTDGLPELVVKDIPPRGESTLVPAKPQIYYGEHKNEYCITNTNLSPGEFDYPSGDTNSYTVYNGNGGIPMGGFLKRMLFALSFGDINILISPGITGSSRIHYNRNIVEIADKLAPWLVTDQDPYLVSTQDRLYFMIDAYTVSDRFPYSTPVQFNNRSVNYISNSAKIVIDAYDGTATIYVTGADPILPAWVKMLGTKTKPLSQMPDELKKHIRYPEGLFDVQVEILRRYHMSDPNVFYNNEDAWEIPRQIYDAQEIIMESNYLVTKLPGQEKPGFVILMPYTPRNKDNMIAFLVAQCDGDAYGNLMLYRLPKDKLTYGPMQIESRITQDPEISRQLTLWNQKGSSVIRGNILAIPLGNSLLYVEPIYLKAETSEMPELKRVIAAAGDRIVMEENIEKALLALFGSPGITSSVEPAAAVEADQSGRASAAPAPAGRTTEALAKEASAHYNRAMTLLKNGDFAGFGSAMKDLEESLKRLEVSASPE